jgi:heterodisulfide reductase subunit A-like polyferredoxin
MATEKVLIVGGGFAGISTAVALSQAGIPSTVIETGDALGGRLLQIGQLYQTGTTPREVIDKLVKEAEDSDKVEFLKQTQLAAVSGVAGGFECRFRSETDESSHSVGAIVTATGSVIRTPEGLEPLSKILELPSEIKSACIILAPGGSSSAVQTEAALNGAISLRDRDVEVSVLYQQMKVSGTGLQTLYDNARESGVVFSRYASFPEINKVNGAFQVDFTVEDLAQRVRMYCDAVLSEGEEVPSPGARKLAAVLDIDTDGAGFFQSENVSLYPVATRRRGIFAVGSCRKGASLEEVTSDAYCTAGQIRELFTLLREGSPVQAPVVDTELCAFCLTCYRACPHRAIGFDYENRAPKILENACFACGICVVECPARAIKFEDDKGKESPARAKIAAFLCSHSAAGALKKLKERNLEIPEMIVEEVPCSGRIEIPHLLEAFERGADGVLVAGCHKGSCRSLTGSHYAMQRSERVRKIMEQVGLQPEKLEMVFISDIEPVELSKALCDFAKRLEGAPVGE